MISDRPGADTVLGGRLTPETVRRIDFPRTPLGRRGYHETDVERFRNRVVLEIVTANAEKAELRQEIQRLRDYYRRQGIAQQSAQSTQSSQSNQQSGQTGVSPQGGSARRGARAVPASEPETAGPRGSAPSTGQLSVDAVNVMSRAQQAADQHIAQAEEYARRLIATSRAQYEEILVHAHEQAEKASAEAALIIERQQELAQQAASAREAAMSMTAAVSSDAPAPDQRVDADASLIQPSFIEPSLIDPDQAAHLLQLESRLTYMRTFAQVTQVQLRSILDALGEELEHLSVPVPNA